MDNDFDRSLDRLVRGEETRARLTGFGTSKQGQAIGQRYRAPACRHYRGQPCPSGHQRASGLAGLGKHQDR
jgi:hypothetical protein